MTEMRDIDELLPEVMTHAPACPEPVALKHLRDAAREFCHRTRMWRDWDTLTVSTPECEAVCSMRDARIVEIERATLNDYALEPKTVGWLDANIPRWDTYDGADVARFVTQLNRNTVTVVPKVEGTLKLRLVLQPSRDAMTLPSFLIDDFGTEIGIGAAGAILMLPQVDYANPALGAALQSQFNRLLDKKAAEAQRTQLRARQRTKPRYF